MASRTAEWTLRDFLAHFEEEIGRAEELRFREQFRELTDELSLLDAEFMKQKKGCGAPLEAVIDRLHSIAGREAYCERPRGFQAERHRLHDDVDEAIRRVREYRRSCTE